MLYWTIAEMQSFILKRLPNGSYDYASRVDVDGVVSAFEGLYQPNDLTLQTLRAHLHDYDTWKFGVDDKTNPLTTSVEEWIEALTASEISPEFRRCLATVSSSQKSEDQRAALMLFDLSRFCEFRAALLASKLNDVAGVRVAKPNSSEDSRKADLLIVPKLSKTWLPVQIKASIGKQRGTDVSARN